MQTAPGWCFKNNSEKRTLLLCAGHECTVSPTRVAKATHGAAFERVPAEPRAGSRELRDAGASPARVLSWAPPRSAPPATPRPAPRTHRPAAVGALFLNPGRRRSHRRRDSIPQRTPRPRLRLRTRGRPNVRAVRGCSPCVRPPPPQDVAVVASGRHVRRPEGKRRVKRRRRPGPAQPLPPLSGPGPGPCHGRGSRHSAGRVTGP